MLESYCVLKVDKKGEIVGFSFVKPCVLLVLLAGLILMLGFSPCFILHLMGFLFCLSLGHSLVLAHASCGPALAISCQSFHALLSYIGC